MRRPISDMLSLPPRGGFPGRYFCLLLRCGKGSSALRCGFLCHEARSVPRPDAASFLYQQKGCKNWLGFRPDGFRHLPPAFRARTPDPIYLRRRCTFVHCSTTGACNLELTSASATRSPLRSALHRATIGSPPLSTAPARQNGRLVRSMALPTIKARSLAKRKGAQGELETDFSLN